jgi:hypothetical protein
MDAAKKAPRGRPRTGTAMSGAERMRAYRRRLRERGVRARTTLRTDPFLAAMRFAPLTCLTPGEQDVLRRFCAGLARIGQTPRKVAVFGSRARGSSHAGSDLDVAVFLDGDNSADIERALARVALRAQAPYREGAYGIHLKPVALFRDAPRAFLESIAPDLEVVWTRPL